MIFETGNDSRDTNMYPYEKDEIYALDFYSSGRIPESDKFIEEFGEESIMKIEIRPYRDSPRHANIYLDGKLVARAFVKRTIYEVKENLTIV